MAEEMGLFLLDQFLEDADVFVFCNFDRKYPLFVVTENKAVEQKGHGTYREWHW